MDYSKIIYIVLPIIGFIISLKSTKTFIKAASSFFLVGIFLISMFSGVIDLIGLSIYLLTLLSVIIYSLRVEFSKSIKRYLLLFPTLFLFLYFLFKIQHYPGSTIFMYISTIFMLISIYLMIKNFKTLKDEFAIIFIVNSEILITQILFLTR
jgi:hypothetical protein